MAQNSGTFPVLKTYSVTIKKEYNSVNNPKRVLISPVANRRGDQEIRPGSYTLKGKSQIGNINP